ncbi:unnamed protein product [Cyclocybe aegerita]|uniref:Uncharacterized protein n=1 Tax=Cyclocybe aegerita TaxID=1973307 RepID=A0A8S0WRQ7_CYCAE|nr:unnamed protein product [Cyclocybe aegerita]
MEPASQIATIAAVPLAMFPPAAAFYVWITKKDPGSRIAKWSPRLLPALREVNNAKLSIANQELGEFLQAMKRAVAHRKSLEGKLQERSATWLEKKRMADLFASHARRTVQLGEELSSFGHGIAVQCTKQKHPADAKDEHGRCLVCFPPGSEDQDTNHDTILGWEEFRLLAKELETLSSRSPEWRGLGHIFAAVFSRPSDSSESFPSRKTPFLLKIFRVKKKTDSETPETTPHSGNENSSQSDAAEPTPEGESSEADNSDIMADEVQVYEMGDIDTTAGDLGPAPTYSESTSEWASSAGEPHPDEGGYHTFYITFSDMVNPGENPWDSTASLLRVRRNTRITTEWDT